MASGLLDEDSELDLMCSDAELAGCDLNRYDVGMLMCHFWNIYPDESDAEKQHLSNLGVWTGVAVRNIAQAALIYRMRKAMALCSGVSKTMQQSIDNNTPYATFMKAMRSGPRAALDFWSVHQQSYIQVYGGFGDEITAVRPLEYESYVDQAADHDLIPESKQSSDNDNELIQVALHHTAMAHLETINASDYENRKLPTFGAPEMKEVLKKCAEQYSGWPWHLLTEQDFARATNHAREVIAKAQRYKHPAVQLLDGSLRGKIENKLTAFFLTETTANKLDTDTSKAMCDCITFLVFDYLEYKMRATSTLQHLVVIRAASKQMYTLISSNADYQAYCALSNVRHRQRNVHEFFSQRNTKSASESQSEQECTAKISRQNQPQPKQDNSGEVQPEGKLLVTVLPVSRDDNVLGGTYDGLEGLAVPARYAVTTKQQDVQKTVRTIARRLLGMSAEFEDVTFIDSVESPFEGIHTMLVFKLCVGGNADDMQWYTDSKKFTWFKWATLEEWDSMKNEQTDMMKTAMSALTTAPVCI